MTFVLGILLPFLMFFLENTTTILAIFTHFYFLLNGLPVFVSRLAIRLVAMLGKHNVVEFVRLLAIYKCGAKQNTERT